MDKDTFTWSDKELIIQEPINALAVYANQFGDIVIREHDPFEPEDRFIAIPRSVIPKLIKALRATLKESQPG